MLITVVKFMFVFIYIEPGEIFFKLSEWCNLFFIKEKIFCLLCIKVLYKVEGFVDKNNDLLYRDLSQAMYKANHSLMKMLFPEGNPAKVNLKRPPTAGFQFKASVGTLMSNLQTKNPNYIRYLFSLLLNIHTISTRLSLNLHFYFSYIHVTHFLIVLNFFLQFHIQQNSV